MSRRAAEKIGLVVAAACLSAGAACGCRGKTADLWLKEKLSPTPTEVRVARIESARSDERREALETVAKDAEARKSPPVVRLYGLVARTDADPLVRAAAVQGLGRMEGEEVLAVLSEVVRKDRDPYVRCDAAAALGQHRKAGGVPALADALRNDPEADVRVEAAAALRRIKDRAAAAALLAALGDKSLAVSHEAWVGLRYMTGKDLPRDSQTWNQFLASSESPLAGYAKPSPLPKGASQRPWFIKGIRDFFNGLLAKDVREAELE